MSIDHSQRRVLVLAYGNPGRQDDGLGPAAAAAIERWRLPNVTVEANYLLNIEDAADAIEHEVVLFVDAAAEGPEPFEMRMLQPAEQPAFTSHIVPPETLLAICRQCYGGVPEAWLLAIRGYEFELVEAMTERARRNLSRALDQVRTWLSRTCAVADADTASAG
jgi:hydrogenase maturation protease